MVNNKNNGTPPVKKVNGTSPVKGTNGPPTVQLVSGSSTAKSEPSSHPEDGPFINLEKQKQTAGNLATKLLTSSTSSQTSQNDVNMDEANARFFKYLQQTYSVTKSLDDEVAAATNTKREIKTLVVQLSANVKGLIQWGRFTGKVNVSTSSRGNQTDLGPSVLPPTNEVPPESKTAGVPSGPPPGPASVSKIPSPDRTRFELLAAIEGLRQQLKTQGEAVGKLTEQVERLQNQNQQEPRKQQQQREPLNPRQPQIDPGPAQEKPKQQTELQVQRVLKKDIQQHQGHQQPGAATNNSESETREWKEVTKRQGTKNPAKAKQNTTTKKKPDAEALVRRRAPRTEAVTIAAPADGETYASVMRLATSCIDLQEHGIEIGRVLRTKAGAILMEISGKEKADKLSTLLCETLGQRAKVSRPRRTIPVLVINIPEWLDDDKVKCTIVEADPGLDSECISIRENAGGGKVAKLTVDMDTALRLSALKSIRIGWNMCRVKLLKTKSPICYRCQASGHTAAECQATDASPKKCYRCRGVGHLAATCQAARPEHKKSGASELADKGVND